MAQIVSPAEAAVQAVVLAEVQAELVRTWEQLGAEATAADYAADVTRRLSHVYATEF